MPLYEYYCPTCKTRFELLRAMSEASDATTCPSGHRNAERILSLVAARAWDGASDSMSSPGGGGCACGGACSCGGH